MDKAEVLRLIDDAHDRFMIPFVIVIPVAQEVFESSKLDKDEIEEAVRKAATDKLMEYIYAK